MPALLPLADIRRAKFARLVVLLLFAVAASLMALPSHATPAQIAALVIPELSIQAEIVSVPMALPTWDVSWIGHRVGYLEGIGGWVGRPGNLVLAGHALMNDRTPGIFHDLPALTIGDEIDVYANGTERRYSVIAARVVNDHDMTPVLPTANEQLTLLTCDPGSYDAARATYTQRYVVVAAPIG